MRLLKEESEDREFQLQMLETQILHDGFSTIITVFMAVIFSWVAATYTLLFANVVPEIKISLLTNGIIGVFVGIGLGVVFIVFNFFFVPWRLDRIRKDFIKNKLEKKSKSDNEEPPANSPPSTTEHKSNSEEKILDLIRLIDSNKNKLFRPYDFLYGLSSFFLIIAILYIATEPIMIFSTSSASDKIIIALSLVAVVLALTSIIIPFSKENIIERNFQRMEKNIKENDKKPLLKALIRIKAKELEFDLEQIYHMHKDMFTKEKLLEQLYD
jgi:uncharacterized protein YacL